MLPGGLLVTELDAATFGIIERMATMMVQMIETANPVLGQKAEKEAGLPPRGDADLRVVFLPPTRAEDAQTEGCNV